MGVTEFTFVSRKHSIVEGVRVQLLRTGLGFACDALQKQCKPNATECTQISIQSIHFHLLISPFTLISTISCATFRNPHHPQSVLIYNLSEFQNSSIILVVFSRNISQTCQLLSRVHQNSEFYKFDSFVGKNYLNVRQYFSRTLKLVEFCRYFVAQTVHFLFRSLTHISWPDCLTTFCTLQVVSKFLISDNRVFCQVSAPYLSFVDFLIRIVWLVARWLTTMITTSSTRIPAAMEKMLMWAFKKKKVFVFNRWGMQNMYFLPLSYHSSKQSRSSDFARNSVFVWSFEVIKLAYVFEKKNIRSCISSLIALDDIFPIDFKRQQMRGCQQ